MLDNGQIVRFLKDKLATNAKNCDIVVSIYVLHAEGYIESEEITDLLLDIYGGEECALEAVLSVPPELSHRVIEDVRRILKLKRM